ncbi:MAG: hypothetical protein ABIF40_03300 [archaeon]
MKLFTLLFFILLLVPLVFADLEHYKTDYYVGETFQLEITEYESVDVSDIIMYNWQGVEVEIGKILLTLPEESYFVYFNIPNHLASGSYSVFVSGLKDGEEENESIEFSLTYHNTTIEYLTLKPGGFFIEDLDKVDLTVFNWGDETSDIFITSDDGLNPVRTSLTIEPSSLRKLTVNIEEGITEKKFLTLSMVNNTYYVPFFFSIPEEPEEEIICVVNESLMYECDDGTEVERCVCSENQWDCLEFPEEECPMEEPSIPAIEFELKLMIDEDSLETTLTQKQRLTATVPIYNEYNYSLTNVQVVFGGNLAEVLTVSPMTIGVLDSNELREFDLIVNDNFDADAELYFGTLSVMSDEGPSDSITLYFEVTESTDAEETTLELPFNYSELDTGEEDSEDEENVTRNRIIGIILLIVLIITFYFLWKRLKPRISSKKLSDIGK